MVFLSSYYVEFGDKTVAFCKGAVHIWFRMPVLVSKFESARANNPIWLETIEDACQ